MPDRVEHHPHVCLRLEGGEPRARLQGPGDARFKILDGDVVHCSGDLAADTHRVTEQEVHQIYTVGCDVVKRSAASHRWIEAPPSFFGWLLERP